MRCRFLICATWVVMWAGVVETAAAQNPKPADKQPEFDPEEKELKPFELTTPPDVDPSEIDLTEPLAKPLEDKAAKFYDKADSFENAGGGLKAESPGATIPKLEGGSLKFTPIEGGAGNGMGLAGRGRGSHEARVARYGGSKGTERAVAAALNWLARHQQPDGSWSLGRFSNQCQNQKCGDPGTLISDGAGTALALLPFLAADQSPAKNGPYRMSVRKALTWLQSHQAKSGGFSGADAKETMYTQALCTLALCETYRMTRDIAIAPNAQAAVKYLESMQDPTSGGWREHPQDAPDMSVTGWQIIALQSAKGAGLKIAPTTLEQAKKYLGAVSGSPQGSLFSFRPGTIKLPTMTAEGLLCRQYLGAAANDPGLAEGVKYLTAHPATDAANRNIYYCYFSTLTLFNMQSDHQQAETWQAWNRAMRRLLVDSQTRGQTCATGSWTPLTPAGDRSGFFDGRLATTSLACLTLEVYYSYGQEPLYQSRQRNQPAALSK